MFDNIDKTRLGAKLMFKFENAVDTEDKQSLYGVIDGINRDHDDICQPYAATLLYGLIDQDDIPSLKERLNHVPGEVAIQLFIVLAGTLKEDGQDYYLEKFEANDFPMKYVALHAVHKFGDERFILPCREYLEKQMKERPTLEEVRAFIQGKSKKRIKDQVDYLRSLSDVLAIIEYFKRISGDEYQNALSLLLENEDRLEARERRYLRDEHSMTFHDYQ